MINEINLPLDRFQRNTVSGFRRKNYIFGKNGTGKSTITNIIQSLESERVFVFKGEEGIIREGEGLNGIALGIKNVNAEDKIRQLKKEINLLESDLLENGKTYINTEVINNKFSTKTEQLKRLMTDKAKEINERLNLGHSFNRRSLDLYTYDEKNKLDEFQLELYEELMLSSELPQLSNTLNVPKLTGVLEKVNRVRDLKILPDDNLTFDIDQEKWVKKGIDLHKPDSNGMCLFCGQPLTEQRLSALENYFNNGLNDLDKQMQNVGREINQISTQVEEIQVVDIVDIYPELHSEVDEMNTLLNQFKADAQSYLKLLREGLEEKDYSKFSSLEPIIPVQPDFSELMQANMKLISENNEYAKNLAVKKQDAKEKLKLHYSQLAVEDPSYVVAQTELANAEREKNEQEVVVRETQSRISSLKEELREVVATTTDEKEAVTRINQDLRALGSNSFQLEYVAPVDYGDSRGQYQIKGIDNQLRSVDKLSTGERNLIAFLWFLNFLDADQDPTDRVIVFDDPMTSNDDASQYLIIAELNKLMTRLANERKGDQTFILTHNVHFYMQLKPLNPQYKDQKLNDGKPKITAMAFFRLKKIDGKTAVIKISSQSEDVSTVYETLWEELYFSYKNDKVTFMWNTMRRILEGYNRFMYGQTSPSTLGQKTNPDTRGDILFQALLKGLHVNSHVAYETDTDLSGIEKDDLLSTFKAVFETIGATQHYDVYWNAAQKSQTEE
ncbi:AAA family ATPase [Weissella cibaria]|nr:AAA family ATPase [Weissella cibaria]